MQNLDRVQKQVEQVAKLMEQARVLLNKREKIIEKLFVIFVEQANKGGK